MRFDLPQYWYRRSLHLITLLLLPFSWLFGVVVSVRRFLYRIGLFKSYRFATPIIVVGNITVGGTGKTPFVIWLTQFLQEQGYQPGIVSRGVGGRKHKKPYLVQQNDKPREVGDEAILLANNTRVPLVVCFDRVAAVNHLLENSDCNVVISDDGLQHYRLKRDIAIAMVDGQRLFGNGRLLPAGPLREPKGRLKQVDFVIMNGGEANDGTYAMSVAATKLIAIHHPQRSYDINNFPYKTVHALAGIGHPERFFMLLKGIGFEVIPHRFPDHYHFQPQDIRFADTFPIIMTEKDAVKCTEMVDERYWYLKIDVKLNASFSEKLLEKLRGCHV